MAIPIRVNCRRFRRLLVGIDEQMPVSWALQHQHQTEELRRLTGAHVLEDHIHHSVHGLWGAVVADHWVLRVQLLMVRMLQHSKHLSLSVIMAL